MNDRPIGSTANPLPATSPQALALNVAIQQRLDVLQQSETSYPATVSFPAADLDAWGWLAANAGQTRVAWSDRESDEVIAGIGTAATVNLGPDSEVAQIVSQCREKIGGNQQLKFFGGLSFDGSADWDGFGSGAFVIPRVLLEQGTLTVAVMDEADLDNARRDLEQIRFEEQSLPQQLPLPVAKSYLPTFDGWQSRIDEALSLIRSEVLEKIVLSRKTKLEFDETLNPISLASELKNTTHDCFVFCYDFGHESAFVGATPERLFLREGRQLLSEVVAGTRLRGEDSVDDERLAVELLTSDKDQREHDIVRKSIRQKLHKFVDHLQVDTQASILRLARKQHLRSNVEGTLKADVSDDMLLARLHPTPAVGGYPTENALPEIARIEPFGRGWYSAPVGWIGAESAQFAVAIRSGFVEGKTLSLFSGAGIVRGSDPDEEWREVENKVQDFISVLG